MRIAHALHLLFYRNPFSEKRKKPSKAVQRAKSATAIGIYGIVASRPKPSTSRPMSSNASTRRRRWLGLWRAADPQALAQQPQERDRNFDGDMLMIANAKEAGGVPIEEVRHALHTTPIKFG